MLRYLTVFGAVALLVGVFSVLYVFACEDNWCAVFDWQKTKVINSFEECVARGFPVMESYPRQCNTGDEIFTEDISGEDSFQNQLGDTQEDVGLDIQAPSSGITGKILIGPICRVAQAGREEECVYRPHKTSLRIYDTDKNLVKVILSDENGEFEAGLPPGSYVLDSDGEEVEPYTVPQIVLVEKDKFTSVIFNFDSDIR